MNIVAEISSLRALSIAGAYPWLIASGRKQIELRVWEEKKYRGLVLIHSSSGSNYEASFAEHGVIRQQCPKFAIIGCATLVDVVCYDSHQKWERDIDRHLWDEDYGAVLDCYDGRTPYGHVMEDAIAFDTPILDVPGAFNYWQPKKDRQRLGFEKAAELLKGMGYLS